MAQVKFYRGLKAKYAAEGAHENGVYFATDTYELLMNGQAYGLSKADAATLSGSVKSVAIDASANTITVTKNDDTKSTISLALSIKEATGKTADATLEAGKQYELTVGKESVVIAMPEKDAAKADQKLNGATEDAVFGGTQTITLSGVTDAEGSTATITIPELTAAAGTNTQGTYVSVTPTLSEGKLSVVVNDSAIDTKLSGYVTKDSVSVETDHTVTIAADGTSDDIKIATVDGKEIKVAVDASAIAGAAEKIDASGSNGTLVNVEVAAKSSADGKGSVTVTVDETGLADKIEELEGAVIGGSDSDDANLITVTTAAKTAAPTVSAKLTASTATASAIATKEYVDEKAASEATVYTFGDDASFAKDGETENYKVTVPLMKQVGEADAVKADEIVLTLDASEFVKDSFLQSAKMGTGGKASTLILTVKLADGTTKDLEVDLSKFIDVYTEGNGITIADHTVSVKVPTSGYIDATEDGVIIKDSEIEKGTATGASTKLATKGYVDEKAAAGAVTVTSTDVKAFGASGSISVKVGTAEAKTFAVDLPGFTKGESASKNASVSIANNGAITVTTTEQAATDTTTYTNSKLAQAGYVDEKVASAIAGVTGGSDESGLVQVTTAAITAAPTVGVTVTEKSAKDNTTALTNTALASKEYADSLLEWIEVVA